MPMALAASPGKYLVVRVDPFDESAYPVAESRSLKKARTIRNKENRLRAEADDVRCIYNDHGLVIN